MCAGIVHLERIVLILFCLGQVSSSQVATPILHVVSVTPSKIQLTWNLTNDGDMEIEEYEVYAKREYGEWEKTDVSSVEPELTLKNLHCGSFYHIYVVAYNKFGQRSESSVREVFTTGAAPKLSSMKSLIEPGMNFVTINFKAWISRECPIHYYTVEYKPENAQEWILVSNNINRAQRELNITEPFTEGERYIVRVTASNDAGLSVSEITFEAGGDIIEAF